jgi:hypothetical protein
MAYLGLRVGSCLTSGPQGNRRLTFAKGKEHSGEISDGIRVDWD